MKIVFYLQRFAKIKTVRLTKKDDTYTNRTPNVKILALDGNDSIENDYGISNVTIDGGAGADSIFSGHAVGKISISGGAGNDYIYGDGNATILGGKGNDNIGLSDYNNVIQYASGDGNDTVYSGFNSTDTLYITKGSYSTMIGDSENDFVVKVGNNTISLHGAGGEYNKIHIKDSEGNVVVYNDWKIMKGTRLDDELKNCASNVTVSGYAGNDNIENKIGSYVTVLAGADDDRIYSESSYSSFFDGGTGNDDITSKHSDNVTVLGGKGNDNIWVEDSDSVKIDGGAGNDSITYGGSEDKGKYLTIDGGTGNDYISNWGDNVTINGGDGKDTIEATHNKNLIISGGKGNDYIHDEAGENSTVYGGAGNDTINSFGTDSTINAGKGNDVIYVGSSTGAAGSKQVIQYASGDGNDTIESFNSGNTLHITKGNCKVKTSGNDVIVTVGKGKITLKDAKIQQISIKDSKGKTKTYSSNMAELFAENNFMTADNLSEIVENNLTATDYKFESKNFETLTHENKFVTYSEK